MYPGVASACGAYPCVLSNMLSEARGPGLLSQVLQTSEHCCRQRAVCGEIGWLPGVRDVSMGRVLEVADRSCHRRHLHAPAAAMLQAA